MRKLAYIGVSSLVLLFTSCMEEIDNWYTNTAAYDGRFVIAATCDEYSSDNTTIEDGEELMMYNSAANIENQIIVDVHVAGFALKGKFDVTGDAREFTATTPVDNISRAATYAGADLYLLSATGDFTSTHPSTLAAPTTAGVERAAIQLYARLSLELGKIMPDGATTIGGNVSDSVYVETTMYADYLTIESYQTPQAGWADSTIPEFAWRIKDGSRTNADGWEEHWTFSGYRYTGFFEDGNPSVPIVEN